jgi:hypothetical protein
MTFCFKELCKGKCFDSYGNTLAPAESKSFWARLKMAWAVLAGQGVAVRFDK